MTQQERNAYACSTVCATQESMAGACLSIKQGRTVASGMHLGSRGGASASFEGAVGEGAAVAQADILGHNVGIAAQRLNKAGAIGSLSLQAPGTILLPSSCL